MKPNEKNIVSISSRIIIAPIRLFVIHPWFIPSTICPQQIVFFSELCSGQQTGSCTAESWTNIFYCWPCPCPPLRLKGWRSSVCFLLLSDTNTLFILGSVLLSGQNEASDCSLAGFLTLLCSIAVSISLKSIFLFLHSLNRSVTWTLLLNWISKGSSVKRRYLTTTRCVKLDGDLPPSLSPEHRGGTETPKDARESQAQKKGGQRLEVVLVYQYCHFTAE